MITSSGVSASTNPLRKFIENSAIKQFVKDTYFYKGGETPREDRPLSPGNQTYAFNVMNASSAALGDVTLSEGVTPAGRNLTFTQVVVSMTQYGDFVTITDVVAKDNPFPLIEESAFELGRRMAEILDAIVQSTLIAGTQTIIKTVGDATTVRASLVAADVMKAKRLSEAFAKLRANAVPMLDGGYVAFMHPNVAYDLKVETTTGAFIDAAKYSAPEKIWNGEIGKIGGVRVVEAPNLVYLTSAQAGGGINVYPTYVIGKWAYGVVKATELETIYQDFGSSGTADPLKQRATVGVKARFGSALLKQESLVRIESSSSLG